MPRNPRQRRRFQTNTKQQRIIIILSCCLSFLVGALIISLVFNFTKSSEQPINEVASNDVEASQEDEFADEDNGNYDYTVEFDDDMYAVLNDDGSDNEKVEDNGDTSFVVTALGNIMCPNTLYEDCFNESNHSYDFSHIFSDIKYFTQTSDFAIANLETTFSGESKGYSGYPKFNTPESLTRTLKNIGIDVVSTASNHCLDFGFEGLSNTIDVLDQADLSHTGTFKSENLKNNILFKYAKGVKIAVINYTYGTNVPIPNNQGFCVNITNKDSIKNDIEKAKSQKADLIIACMHWGDVSSSTPNDNQKNITDYLFKNGVDIILGTHPQLLQPMEKRTVTLDDGTQKDGFVIYSLGSLITDQDKQEYKNSIVLNINVTKHENGTISIDGVKYLPTNFFKSDSENQKYKVLDINTALTAYDSGNNYIGNNYDYLKNQVNDITSKIKP